MFYAHRMKSICVFCGSSLGNNSRHQQAASELGKLFAEHKIQLIYGGSSQGLMGLLAKAALENKGRVIGIVPDFLFAKEPPMKDLHAVHIVSSMHERKMKMAELADAFIALPGGFGTLDEFYEIITWKQIGLHSKPIGLLNSDGFFDSLIAQAEEQIKLGFVAKSFWEQLLIETSPSLLLSRIANELVRSGPID